MIQHNIVMCLALDSMNILLLVFVKIMEHIILMRFLLTNYAHLNRGSINLVDMVVTYWPGIVGT